MHPLPSILCFVFCAGGGGLEPTAVPAVDAPPLVVRIHDLGRLQRPEDPKVREELLPYISIHRLRPENILDELHVIGGQEWPPAPPEEAAELLVDLLGEELHQQDCHWQLGPGGRWLLVAPEATQRRAAETLAVLDRHLNASVRLRIDVLDLDLPAGRGEAGDLGGAAQASHATVEALLAAAGEQGALRTVALELGTGRTETIDLSRVVWSLFGYDSEVAQMMMASVPLVAVVPVGLRLSLRATPSAEGVHLAGVVQDSRIREAPDTRRIGRSGLLTPESGPAQVPLPGVFSRLTVERRAFTLNAHLGRESALLLSSEVVAGTLRRRQVVILRIEAGELPFLTDLGTHDGKRTTLLDSGALAPSMARNGGYLAPGMPRPRALVGSRFTGSSLVASIEDGDPELFDELISRLELEQAGFGPQRVLRHATDAAAPDLMELQALLAPPAHNLELHLVLRRSGSLEAIATCTLPVAMERPTSVLLGSESTRVIGHAVEIAQGASIPEPLVDSVFDGLVVVARALAGPAGGPAEVQLDAFAHILDEDASIALGTATMERIDTPRLRTLFAGGRVPADGAVHRLGDEGTAEGSLVLEVRVR